MKRFISLFVLTVATTLCSYGSSTVYFRGAVLPERLDQGVLILLADIFADVSFGFNLHVYVRDEIEPHVQRMRSAFPDESSKVVLQNVYDLLDIDYIVDFRVVSLGDDFYVIGTKYNRSMTQLDRVREQASSESSLLIVFRSTVDQLLVPDDILAERRAAEERAEQQRLQEERMAQRLRDMPLIDISRAHPVVDGIQWDGSGGQLRVVSVGANTLYHGKLLPNDIIRKIGEEEYRPQLLSQVRNDIRNRRIPGAVLEVERNGEIHYVSLYNSQYGAQQLAAAQQASSQARSANTSNPQLSRKSSELEAAEGFFKMARFANGFNQTQLANTYNSVGQMFNAYSPEASSGNVLVDVVEQQRATMQAVSDVLGTPMPRQADRFYNSFQRLRF